MNTNDITVTDSSLIRKLSNVIDNGNKLRGDGETRDELKDSLRLKQGVLLKYYTGIDKALIQLNDNNRKVLAKIIHPLIGSDINISFIPHGYEGADNRGFYIEPYENLHVLCLEIEYGSNNTELGLIGFISLDNQDIASNGYSGEVSLKLGDTVISINNERVSITANNIFWNGMPFNQPKFNNIYEKNDVDTNIENVTSAVEDVNSNFASRLSRLESIVFENGFKGDDFEGLVNVNITPNLKKEGYNSVNVGESISCIVNRDNDGGLVTGLNVDFLLTRLTDKTVKEYTVTSNINGECLLPINLAKGDYSVCFRVNKNLNFNYTLTDVYYFTVE